MSNSIDERIVQMKFDNTLFERNVATSIGTLEKLKSALDFSGATNSLSNIERNINAADFSKLANSIQSISDRFSNWGIVGMTVIQDLVHAAENLGGKMYNATVGQIKSGGWSRATNIDKAKFAIEGLNQSWEELSKSIDKAVTDTRFGFDEAATAASQLVASNVAVGDEMDNALKSIANVASQTGDEYSSIAHIYTTIAGNGKMMTEQMNMFSYRGLNVASMMANVWGKTEAEVREMATKGEISFKMFSDAMNEALGEGAKRANDTFEGSMANMKAALSRIGQPFAASIRAYAPSVFNTLKDQIKTVKTALEPLEKKFDDFASKLSNLLTNVIKNIDLSFVDRLVEGAVSVFDIIDKIMKKVTPFWAPLKKDVDEVAGAIENAENKVANFANSMLAKKDQLLSIPSSAWSGMEKVVKEAETSSKKLAIYAGTMLSKKNAIAGIPTSAWESMKKVHDQAEKTVVEIVDTSEHIDEMAKKVIAGDFGKGQKRFDALEEAGENWKVIQNRVNEMTGSSYRYEVAENAVVKAVENSTEAENANANAVKKRKNAMDAVSDMLSALGEKFREFTETIDKNAIVQKVAIIINGIKDGVYVAIRIFSIFLNAALKPTLNFLNSIVDAISNSWATVTGLASEFRSISDTGDVFIRLEGSLNFIFGMLSGVGQSIVGLFGDVTSILIEVLAKIDKFTLLYAIVDLVMSVSEKVNEVITDFRENLNKSEVADKLTRFINGIQDGLSLIVRLFSVVLNAAIKPVASVLGAVLSTAIDLGAEIGDVFTALKTKAENSGFFQIVENFLNTVFGFIANIAKDGISVLGTIGSFIISVFGKVGDLFFSLIARINAFVKIFKNTESFKNLSEAFGKLSDKISELKKKGFDAIQRALDKFKKTKVSLPVKPFNSLLNVATWLADRLTSFITWLVDKVDINKIISWLTDKLTKANKALKTIGGTVKNVAKSAFKGFLSIVTDLGGRISELWSTFKESKAFETIKSGLDTVKEKAVGAKDKLVDLFTNDETGEFEFPKITWEGVKQTWFNVWDWIKERFFAAKAWIEEKISNITGKEFHFPEINLEPLKEKFEKVKNWFIDIFTNDETGEFEFPIDLGNAQQKFDELRGWFTGIFTDEETGEFKFSWEGLQQAFDDVLLFVQGKIDEIKTTIKSLFGGGDEESGEDGETKVPMLERLKSAFDEAILWLDEKVKTIKDLIGGIFGDNEKESKNQNKDKKSSVLESIKESLPTLEDIEKVIGKLFNVILLIQSFKAAVGILESVFQVGEILRQAKGALKEIKGVIKAYKKELKAEARELNARAVLELAAAIAIVSAAFIGLSQLSWEQVIIGATAIIVVAGALSLLFAVVGHYTNKGGKGLTSFEEALTTALNVIGGGLKKIGSALGKIGIAAIIAALTYAVTQIIGVITELTDYSWADARAGLSIVGGVLAELVVAVLALNILDTSGFGRKIGSAIELIAFAYSVKTICDALIELGNEPLDQLKAAEPIMIALMAVLAVGVGLMDLMSNDTFFQRMGSAVEIVAFAYGIKMIADALIELSDSDTDKLESARNAIALVLAAMAAVIAAMTGLSDSANGNLLGPVEALLSAVGIVGTIVGAFYLIKEMDIDAELLEAAGTSLSLVVGAISALMLAINEIVKASSTGAGVSLKALKGVLGEAGIAALITALVTFIGWAVGEFVSVEAIEQAAQTLEAITALIGRFFGGLVGGFVDAIGDEMFGDFGESIMSIPGKISDFMKEFKPVLEDLKTVDASGANALLEVIGVIAACFGAELLGSFTDWFLGKDSLADFGERLETFGTAIAVYSAIVNGRVNEKAVQASANAGQMLADLENNIPNTGLSVLSVIMGDNKLNKFGDRLYDFGMGIVKYSAIVEGRVNEDAVTASVNAGKVLAALEGDVENTGGVLGWIMGDNKLDEFGSRLLKFGRCMRRFCGLVSGHIDQDAVDAATNAGTVLNELEKNLSDQDGKVKEFFFGGSGLDDFGQRLTEFGGHIVGFSDTITGKDGGNGFDNTAVKNAVTTLDKLLTFANKIEAIDENGDRNIDSIADNIFDVGYLLDTINIGLEEVGQTISTDETMSATGVVDNFTAAGEKMANYLVSGFTSKLEELDEGNQGPILKIMIKALQNAFSDRRLAFGSEQKGVFIGNKIIGGLKKAFTEDGEGEEGGFPSFVDEVVKSFQDMIYRILTAMSNSESGFKTRAEGWMKKLQEGINAYKEAIIGSLRNIPIATLTFYGTQNSAFRSAGWNWMMELWEGINSGSSYVYELANSVASNVADIVGGAVSKASAVPSGLSLMIDDFYTLGGRSEPMLNAMNTVANTGLRTATALEGAMNTASSNGEMAFQQLQSVAGIQNGAFSLSRDAGIIAETAAASMSRTASLAKSASMTNPITNQVYVKDSNDTLEALNGMRRDIKVLTENMANMQMVLDSGVLVGQLTPGLDVSLSQRSKFRGRWT